MEMRGVVRASLLALLAGVALMGATTDDAPPTRVEDRGGMPPTVTPEQALAAVVQWADWLGIRAEECSVRLDDPAWSAFSHFYVVTSRDGRHEFRVNGYTGHVTSWRDTHAPPMGAVPEDPGEREALASIARKFISEHLPFLEPAVMVNDENPRLWVQTLDGDVLFESSFARVYASLETGAVHEVTIHRAEPRVDISPRLSPEECMARAVAFVNTIPGVELIDPPPEVNPSFRWRTRYYILSQDQAGVQRLLRTFFMRVSVMDAPATYPRGVASEQRVYVHVDARTGEVFCAMGMVQDPARTRIYLNGREFFGPLFPPRVRDGVAYLAVNYLDSRIWRARMERAVPDRVTIEYGGSTWRFTAGERRYTVDGAKATLASAPILETEVLYLPLEAVELITGWSAAYSPAHDAVYLNAPGPAEDG